VRAVQCYLGLVIENNNNEGTTNMTKNDFTNARVIGYFSIPSTALAEANPTAYNNAMAVVPRGAGSCQHCGMGILHHVIVKLADGSTKFIGSTCAEKVGGFVEQAVRSHQTTEQIELREARFKLRQAEEAARVAAQEAAAEVRAAEFVDVIETLNAQGTDFHSSLARQLRYGSLSHKQAQYVAKAVVGRYSKKTAQQFDAVVDRVTA
jgi:hypothetical protein